MCGAVNWSPGRGGSSREEFRDKDRVFEALQLGGTGGFPGGASDNEPPCQCRRH